VSVSSELQSPSVQNRQQPVKDAQLVSHTVNELMDGWMDGLINQTKFVRSLIHSFICSDEGGDVFTSVCLSVCLSVHQITEKVVNGF